MADVIMLWAFVAVAAAVTLGLAMIVLGPRVRRLTWDAQVLLLYVFCLGPAAGQALSPTPAASLDQAPLPPSGFTLLFSQATTALVAGLSLWALLTTAKSGRVPAGHRRPGASLVAALVIFVLARVVASYFGTGGGLVAFAQQFALDLLVILGLTRRPWTWQEMTHHAGVIFRIYTYGSLVALAVSPDDVTTAVNDRSLFGFFQLAGLTPHPNVLGPLAALALVFEVATRRPRLWYLHALAAVMCLVFVQSRTAWLAAIVGLLLVLVIPARNRRPGAWVYLLPGVVTLAAAAVFITRAPLAQAVEAVFDEQKSLNGRVDIWRVAYAQFRDNVLFGYGPGVFGEEFQKRNPAAGVGGQAHGQIPQSMAEAGLVGLAALLFLWICLLVLAARSGHRKVLVPMVVIVLLDSVTEAPFRGGLSTQAAFVMVVLLLVLAGQELRAPLDRRGRLEGDPRHPGVRAGRAVGEGAGERGECAADVGRTVGTVVRGA